MTKTKTRKRPETSLRTLDRIIRRVERIEGVALMGLAAMEMVDGPLELELAQRARTERALATLKRDIARGRL